MNDADERPIFVGWLCGNESATAGPPPTFEVCHRAAHSTESGRPRRSSQGRRARWTNDGKWTASARVN
jgi:hypothetical protein